MTSTISTAQDSNSKITNWINSIPQINRLLQRFGTQSCSRCGDEPGLRNTGEEPNRWRSAGFGNPQISFINIQSPAGPSYTHELTLSLVMLQNTGWTVGLVETNLNKMARVLSQCHIKMNRAKLVIADAPNGYVDIDRRWTGRDLEIAKSTPITEKPILYFIRSARDGTAAYSLAPSYFDGNKALVDTAWITNDVNSPSHKNTNDPHYSTLAHELGHILLNMGGHVDDGTRNFLAGSYNLLDDEITPLQCDNIRKSNLVKRL